MSTTRNTHDERIDEHKVAHELANLVDGSLRNLGLALSHLRDIDAAATVDDATMQRIQTARTGMEQMAGLLKRWMVESQTSVGLLNERLTIAAAMDRVVHLLDPAASQRGIELVIEHSELADKLPAGPLFPVMLNAMRNAIDAIEATASPAPRDGWRIEIGCRASAGRFEMTVADNGPGVDPSMLDASGRVIAGRTTRPDGHGVGLSLASELAGAMGGFITLENRQPRGAMFTLRCPVDCLSTKEQANGR